jgi:hypothetical protein
MDVSLPVSEHRKSNEDVVVISDLPASIPVGNEEIGLLRAFLSAEINAILRGDDRG